MQYVVVILASLVGTLAGVGAHQILHSRIPHRIFAGAAMIVAAMLLMVAMGSLL